MLKLLLLVTTMVISMSSHAKGPDKGQPQLHPDFFKPPVQKSDSQHTIDFFRMWLLSAEGKDILKLFLEEKIGYDSKLALKTIAFMNKELSNIDQKAQALYRTKQAEFIKQYNQSRTKEEQAYSFHPTLVSREELLRAEAEIQAKLDKMEDLSLKNLAVNIGPNYVADLKAWIRDYHERSAQMMSEIDPEEYLNDLAELNNGKHKGPVLLEQDKSGDFKVIKKDR